MTYFNKLPLLIILPAALFLAGCQKKHVEEVQNEPGLVKRYAEDGRLLQEVHYKDGKLNGVLKDYYENGQVFQEVHYVNNIKHGVVKQYFDTGKPLLITPYDSGKIHGVEQKFRKDGTRAYEAPYDHGEPCVGLKEYVLDGSLKTKYPTIVITPIDRILAEELYTLNISMSDGSAAHFYTGKLTRGRYIGNAAQRIGELKKGTATIQYGMYPGRMVMEQLHIIAKVKTLQGNYYITQRTYNLAIGD